MSASTRANPSFHGNNRVKAKSSPGWASFDHKQKHKQQGLEPEVNDSEAYPLLSRLGPAQILPNKNQALLEKPYSSVLVASMCFPSLTVTHDKEMQRNEPVTNSCLDSADNIENPANVEAYHKLNHLHPWADQNLIQDILAGVNNNAQEALSLLEAMLISEDNREPEDNNVTSSYGNDAASFSISDFATNPPVETEPEWEEDDVYLIHRKDAIRKIRSASRHSKAANDAFLRGDPSSAHLFSVKAQEEWTNAEKLNAKAAAEILTARNDRNDLWTLDLHGLHAAEAVQALQERLQKVESLQVSSNFIPMISVLDNKGSSGLVSASLQSRSHVKMEKFGRQRKLLQAITGKGNHSRGEAALPTAIRSFLSESGYHFDESRAGVIVIRPKFRHH